MSCEFVPFAEMPLEAPDKPGTYTLDPRASEIRIVSEELEKEPAAGEKPRWVKKTGTLQEALTLAFSERHIRDSLIRRDLNRL